MTGRLESSCDVSYMGKLFREQENKQFLKVINSHSTLLTIGAFSIMSKKPKLKTKPIPVNERRRAKKGSSLNRKNRKKNAFQRGKVPLKAGNNPLRISEEDPEYFFSHD